MLGPSAATSASCFPPPHHLLPTHHTACFSHHTTCFSHHTTPTRWPPNANPRMLHQHPRRFGNAAPRTRTKPPANRQQKRHSAYSPPESFSPRTLTFGWTAKQEKQRQEGC